MRYDRCENLILIVILMVKKSSEKFIVECFVRNQNRLSFFLIDFFKIFNIPYAEWGSQEK